MKSKCTRRDLGHNNIVKRHHLVMAETKIYDLCDADRITETLQKVVDTIEHRLTKYEHTIIKTTV